jgi:hypothetical protein
LGLSTLLHLSAAVGAIAFTTSAFGVLGIGSIAQPIGFLFYLHLINVQGTQIKTYANYFIEINYNSYLV